MQGRWLSGGFVGVFLVAVVEDVPACRDKHTQSPQGSSMAYHSPGAPKRLLPGSRQLGRLGGLRQCGTIPCWDIPVADRWREHAQSYPAPSTPPTSTPAKIKTPSTGPRIMSWSALRALSNVSSTQSQDHLHLGTVHVLAPECSTPAGTSRLHGIGEDLSSPAVRSPSFAILFSNRPRRVLFLSSVMDTDPGLPRLDGDSRCSQQRGKKLGRWAMGNSG
jgi:hypothetical protein